MSPDSAAVSARPPELSGQTVVVIGGSAGIGFETARRARAEGADVIVTGRDPARLATAAEELGAVGAEAFDATDFARLDQFFAALDRPIDQVLVTAGGPYYARLVDIDIAETAHDLDAHLWLTISVARLAGPRMRPGGTLIFISGTGSRRPGLGLTIASTMTAAMPALIANLALELAPVRVNLIAPGFVDTGLSASLLGDQLEARRAELRDTLPIGRVVGPADVAALACHLMANTALTGATYDIDGGQQLVPR
jgi:NAD(P)-dependent dehydrogenase (short-subunit alcohol dehydrogenase family)